MFVTHASAQMPIYKVFLDPEETAWAVVRFAARNHRYLVTIEDFDEGVRLFTEFMLSDSDQLRDLLESPKKDSVVAIHALGIFDKGGHGWECRQVQRVWRGVLKSSSFPVTLLESAEGEFLDSMMQLKPKQVVDRQVIIDLTLARPRKRPRKRSDAGKTADRS